jgi:hypothetical protein
MSEKSILEQALLQVNTLEEAVKQNAKGILSSVMKQELNELLKESEEEEEVADDAMDPKAEENDMSEQPDSDDEEADDEDEMPSINDEPSKDIDGEDEEDEDDMFSTDDESPEMEDDELPSMDDMASDDDDTLDMTGAPDEEVLKVFKAMSDEDGIIVKKDGNNIELTDADDEYIIKLDESEEEEEEMSEDWTEEEASDDVADDETIYEIELDDEPEDEAEMSEEDMPAEEEVDEAARAKWNVHGGKRSGLKSKKVFAAGAKNESKASTNAINEEVENLKKQNSEYKKALIMFKDKLNEVAVFNANLAYATRLFTEHSTTKQEKLNILKKFDSISNIKESKNLYNTIKSELDTKKPVTESIVNKIVNTASTSSSQEVLSESKAYEAPQFKRMRDLMSKIK